MYVAKPVRYTYTSKRSVQCEVGNIAMTVYNQMSEEKRNPRRKAMQR